MNTNNCKHSVIQKASLSKRFMSERAACIVEFALTAPILITLIMGIVGTGNVLTQLPWSAHTAYQLASSLAENPRDIGELAMGSRLDQLRIERQSLFSRLGLVVYTPERIFDNNSSFYGTIHGVEVVGMRFNASIRPLMNMQLPGALSIELTAPHLAASVDVTAVNGFADPANTYDCCGIRCGDPGSNCGSPTSCYNSSNLWSAACPAPGTQP